MVDGCTPHLAGNHCLAQAMVMKASDLVSLSFGQLLVSHGVPLCFFGEKKRTRTGSWPLLSMHHGCCSYYLNSRLTKDLVI